MKSMGSFQSIRFRARILAKPDIFLDITKMPLRYDNRFPQPIDILMDKMNILTVMGKEYNLSKTSLASMYQRAHTVNLFQKRFFVI